jgi:hypothetical protein
MPQRVGIRRDLDALDVFPLIRSPMLSFKTDWSGVLTAEQGQASFRRQFAGSIVIQRHLGGCDC